MSQEKIKPVGEEQSSNPSFSADDVSNVRQDMGKVALVISVLAIFLLIIFYYTVNSQVNQIQEQVGQVDEAIALVEEIEQKLDNGIEELAADLEGMTEDLQALDNRVAELENLPAMVRNMVLGGMLEEMSQKTEYVGTQVSPEQQEKLMQARELMREVQESIEQE